MNLIKEKIVAPVIKQQYTSMHNNIGGGLWEHVVDLVVTPIILIVEDQVFRRMWAEIDEFN